MQTWSEWKQMPSPEDCRNIVGPTGPGVYQIRNKVSKQLIQFGIGIECQDRMRSLYPKLYGVGTRNNEDKRNHVLNNWQLLEYRTMATVTKAEAALIERELKSKRNHLFNT